MEFLDEFINDLGDWPHSLHLSSDHPTLLRPGTLSERDSVTRLLMKIRSVKLFRG